MITLNIIPNDLKNENRLKQIYISSRSIVFIIIILILIYSIALLGIKFVLQNHYTDTIEEATLLTKNTENYSKQVDTINSRINAVFKIQSNTTAWSHLIEYFANRLPEGIKLDSLKISGSDKSIALAGTAVAREDLLALKDFLESSDSFTGVELPIKTLLEKENINFAIKTQYTTYDFDEK